KGPDAIINASCNMELYDIETASEVFRRGIYTGPAVLQDDPLEMINQVRSKVAGYLAEGKFVVTLGGEHTVSVGAIQAHVERFDNVSILHLDAHSDRRDEYGGTKYSHACVMARAGEMTDNIVSVGIRSMDSTETASLDRARLFTANEIRKSGTWMQDAVSQLSDNVYITLDLDVFDSSIMPSTGTPEPGGLGWYEVLDLLELAAKNKNIVGFDIVELCPTPNPAPDFLAAKLTYKLLSLIFASPLRVQ
ncbi:agmatinase, partial [bacterium]|nr:agmatinase [bacterium]